MSSVNLTPITKDDRPTSHVRVGRSKVGESADVVEVRHRGRRAFFRVDTEDDRIMNSIGNKAYLHENAADVFGGIDVSENSTFVVDSSASPQAVPECTSATIYPADVSKDRLESHLRTEGTLLHRIEEVARIDGGLARFTVNDMEPADYSTLRVTGDTDIEFADGPTSPTPTAGGGRSSTAGGPRQGEQNDDGPTVSIEPTVPEVSFEDDVAGLDEVKETARMLLALFDTEVRNEMIDRYGEAFTDRSGSMLLYGPPGCGKTHVSEAIAHEAKENTNLREQFGEVKFLEVRGSDIQSKYSGESEKNVRAVFERAHSVAQDGFAVLFFDEVETLVPDRSDDNLQRHERALTNAFLQEMNDIEDNLLVIGATNMPFSIDPAATRRFPIQQFIPQPDEDVVTEVWRKELSSLPGSESIDFERLGEASVGYTPAEISDRILGSDIQRELIRGVVDGEPVELTTEYLLDRLERTEPKTIRQYVTSVREQSAELEGYPELRQYVSEQVEKLDLSTSDGTLAEMLADATDQRGDE